MSLQASSSAPMSRQALSDAQNSPPRQQDPGHQAGFPSSVTPRPAPRLWALVVTCDRPKALQITLERLFTSPPPALERVIVLDNASGPETRALLERQEDPRLEVLRHSQNLGGAGGFEAVLRHVAGLSPRQIPDWLVLMDDDARPDPGTLEKFLATSRTRGEAWAAAVRHPDGRLCEMNRPWRNPFASLRAFCATLRRGRDGFHLGDQDYLASERPVVDGCSFVGLFLSRAGLTQAAQSAGLPDGRLFLYGDDVLFTLGLSRAGGRILFDPELRFEHACASLDPAGVIRPLWKSYYYHRNLLRVYRQVAGPVLFWPVAVLRGLHWLARSPRYGGEARAYRGLLLRALRDGIRREIPAPPRGIPAAPSLSAALYPVEQAQVIAPQQKQPQPHQHQARHQHQER